MNRFRRLRATRQMRNLVAETTLSPKDFIYPMFVIEGENIKEEIPSMPNCYRYSIDRIDEILDEINESKISGIMLFGIPEHKDEVGSEAYNPDGITQRAIKHIKEKYPHIIVCADVCI